MKLEPQQRLQLLKDIAGHIAALVIVVGFFAVLFAVLLGFVDINEPAVIAFVGTAIGYAAGNISPVALYYFGSEPDKPKKDRDG